MLKSTYNLLIVALVLFSSCKKTEIQTEPTQSPEPTVLAGAIYSSWPEGFNSGTKTSYASANVTLATGSWNLSDALLGTSTSDRKFGTQSVRIQNTGQITMNFNLLNGCASVSVYHAKYGTDANSTWGLWISTNGGTSWTQSGSTVTTSTTTLTQANFSPGITGQVRIQIRKLSGGRLNLDDVSIGDNLSSGSAPTRDDHLAFGNPSNAIAAVGSPNNYLLIKPQYVVSYNNSRGTANWVSWHLSSAWKGSATRCDCFAGDNALPTTFFKAVTSNYTNSGFDRGHMCPSEDRDGSAADNAATFLMTNIIPQAPNNNQITWVALENYARTFINSGNEVYILSGAYGVGGTGRNGGTTSTLAGGSITVPSNVWKVLVVLPVGGNDVGRVTSSTRVIAINTPNNQTVRNQPWGYYRTSVDAIEQATGLDLLSNLPDAVENLVEATVDNGPTQ